MIAETAGQTLEMVYARFPRKESFIVGLYERITDELRAQVPRIPTGTVAARFQFLMRERLGAIRPHRRLLRQLLPSMLDTESRLGVLGQSSNRIRAEVQGIYSVAVLGAEDCPPREKVDSLVQLLYFAHLGLTFLFLQDQREDLEAMEPGVQLAGDLISVAQKTLIQDGSRWFPNQVVTLIGFPKPDRVRDNLNKLVEEYIRPPHDSSHHSLAENILRELFRFRRLQPDAGRCKTDPCVQCLALHVPKVQEAIRAGRPVPLVLPAFPAKSSNAKKVLGSLPDLGDELALRFLHERCTSLREYYDLGAELVICSDGRVFADLVGVTDQAVTEYRLALIDMIERFGLTTHQVFDLDDVQGDMDHDAMREWLMWKYGEPMDLLVDRTRKNENDRQLFNGIHRFVFEDLVEREPELSRSQARKRSKTIAYEVIRRSNAWSKLVGEFFPDALRLSIHPQPPHSDRIGILLGDADDIWLTPWHGVALLQSERYQLTRRSVAEKRGAILVERSGCASHFEMPSTESSTLPQ